MNLYRQDIARRYGVDVRTVDRWRAEGMLPRPRRTPGGLPFWTEKQLALCERCRLNGKRKTSSRAARAVAWLNKKRIAALQPRARQFNFPLQLNLPVKL